MSSAEPAFSSRTEILLDQAARLCIQHGAKLTVLRRDVLGLILDAGRPVGAYDLLEQLRSRRGPAAPPTVYRALGFLQDQGLVHRIERLSAFVGCIASHDHAVHHHAAQFLICRTCGAVQEMDNHALAHALAEAARRGKPE